MALKNFLRVVPLLAASGSVQAFRVGTPSVLTVASRFRSSTVGGSRGWLAPSAASRSTGMRMAHSVRLSDPAGQMLDKTDVFIFDCDGVIWKGDSLIEGVPAVLDRLRDAGKK